MKKIISILLIFFTIFLQADPVDITKQFCKVTGCTLSPAIKVFFDAYKNGRHVLIRDNETSIGEVEYREVPYLKKKAFYQWVDNLEVYPGFQANGHGTHLMKFVLSRCTGRCQETSLYATPLHPDNKKGNYERLKKFYAGLGGVLESEANNFGEIGGNFTFPAHKK